MIILLSIGVLFTTAPALAYNNPAELELEPSMMTGRTEGTGTYFEISDSEYLNISLKSAKEITIVLESIPRMISMDIGPSTDSFSTKLTISGLEPNTTYYKYQDSYKNKAVFVSNENREYSWTQDLFQSHHIWIQPEKGEDAGVQSKDAQTLSESNGAVFLPEQCSDYGVWNEQTSTCSLTQDLFESVEITANNVTLDCADHSITGSGTGYGIYLNGRESIRIKNCNVTNFSCGFRILEVSNSIFIKNTLVNNYYGAWFEKIFYSNITNNVANFNKREGLLFLFADDNLINQNEVCETTNTYFGGIHLSYSHDNAVKDNKISKTFRGLAIRRSSSNTVINNTITSNRSEGIVIIYSTNNTITKNRILNNYRGIWVEASVGNRVYHNNFIGNLHQAGFWRYQWGNNPFDNNYPSGGNYWKDYTGVDLKSGANQDELGSDGIGDTPYTFTRGQDRYPFMAESGWEESVCGNNVCETGETFENCYQDCVEQGIGKYFPHYYFSLGEKYFPTSFYFDGDAYMLNNQENYDDWAEGFPPFYMYVHTVEDESYFTIQYWLYETFNHHDIFRDHEHDWDGIIFVVFDKSNFAQPLEVRFARHLSIGVSLWEEIEKIDNTHTLVYVAKDSHGGYPSSTMGSKDIWRSGGLKLKPNDFNWYIVENCTDKIWRIPHILPRRYCNVGPELIQGEAQPLPDILEGYEGYWPFSFPGAGSFKPDAPWNDKHWWNDKRWSQTRPTRWWDWIEFSVDCSVDLHVYDSLNRHIGINYETGESEIQIPDAIYTIESDSQYIVIPNPIDGDYKVEIVGVKKETYNLYTIRNKDEEIVYWKEYKDILITAGEIHTFTQTPTPDAVPRFLKQVSVEKLEQLKNDIGALNSSTDNYDNKNFGMNNIRDIFTTAQVSKGLSIDYFEIFANRFLGARLVAEIIVLILILIIIIRIAVIQKQKKKLQDKIINIIKSKEFFQLRYTKMLCCGSIGMFFGIAHSLLAEWESQGVLWFAIAMVFFYFQLKLVKGILEYFPEKKFLFYEFSLLVHFITFLFIFCPIVIPLLPIFILGGLVYGSFSLTLTSFVVPFLLVYFLFKDESKLKRFRYAFILALMIFIFWASIVGVTSFS